MFKLASWERTDIDVVSYGRTWSQNAARASQNLVVCQRFGNLEDYSILLLLQEVPFIHPATFAEKLEWPWTAYFQSENDRDF